MSIKVGIIGVGNCAKSLVQGVAHYGSHSETAGLAFPVIGGYKPEDIEFCLAYDVDARKVGYSLVEAIYAGSNNAVDLTSHRNLYSYYREKGYQIPTVLQGPILDGVAPHMITEDPKDTTRFCLNSVTTDEPTEDEVVKTLIASQIDIALIYLPVGSQKATEFYVRALLRAKVPFVNCIPVFIVSDPEWQRKIVEAGICAIGDDMRSQVGASILSQVLHEMFLNRGAKINFHCQTNQGGNTDFHNMTVQSRLTSKKKSKENVITSQNDLRNLETVPNSVHAGPSDYIPYLQDNKVAHIRIEAEGFGGVPITLDARLSVQDSPNSAGVVIDAIRYLKTATDHKLVGALLGPSAATQKTPPVQMTAADAYEECRRMASLIKR
jgi:myo-inositol-1-phosphate synthase